MIKEYKAEILTEWITKRKLLYNEFLIFIIDGKLEAVNFLCPCGCGSECYTPVVYKGQPHGEKVWEYESGPTITPSIRFLNGCKSHFNITNGKVIMHGDSGK